MVFGYFRRSKAKKNSDLREEVFSQLRDWGQFDASDLANRVSHDDRSGRLGAKILGILETFEEEGIACRVDDWRRFYESHLRSIQANETPSSSTPKETAKLFIPYRLAS